MELNEYQRLAARTINKDLTAFEMREHALHGLSAECGELNGLYKKVYQGHSVDREHALKEAGDNLWMLAEYCTSMGFTLEEVAVANIEKLKKRYPEGFEAEKSLNRAEGDV